MGIESNTVKPRTCRTCRATFNLTAKGIRNHEYACVRQGRSTSAEVGPTTTEEKPTE